MTQNNPGTYYQLLNYLCELDGISPYKLIDLGINYVNDRPKQYKFSFLIGIKDNLVYYFQGLNNDIQTHLGLIPKDTRFDFICFINDIRLKDCPSYSSLNKVGKYKDSLGGGWYSDIDLFEINGLYFAPDMETSSNYAKKSLSTEEILELLKL